MALLGTDECFVGTERRIDGNPAKPAYWPRAYVRVSLAGEVSHLSPGVARALAKHLVAAANVADPPKPRAKRS